MIPPFTTPTPPRPHNKAAFQQQLKELTSNMRQLKLDHHGSLANIRIIDVVELAFGSGIDEEGVARELTSWLIYAKDKNLVEPTDIEAIQDLAVKARIIPEKRSTEIERNLDDVMNQIQHHVNSVNAFYNLREAIKDNDEETITSLLTHNSEAIRQSMKTKITEEGENPLHIAFFLNDKRFIEIMIKHFLDDFKAAILDKDNEGMTPLMAVCAVEGDYSEFVELMGKYAPVEFGQALLIQDNDGNTPLHCASLKNLQIIEKYAPQKFMEGLNIINNNNQTPIMSQPNVEGMQFIFEKNPYAAIDTKNLDTAPLITRIKSIRPADYRKKMTVFKTHKEIAYVGKEISKRLAVSHAFSLSGVTEIKRSGSKNSIKLSLEGHLMPQWFHLMGKTLEKFCEVYPNVLTDGEISYLQENFKWNSMEKASEESLDRINQGLPTIVKAGFPQLKESDGHAVAILFWGDRLIVCNRGEGANIPVDIYHFDHEKLTPEILEEINAIRSTGTAEEYIHLVFKILPNALGLKKTTDDLLLEKISSFPRQTVGNCSYVSPITSVYALLLLSVSSGSSSESELTNLTAQTLAKYQKWLGFQQITILERLIEPLVDKGRTIEPDHRLIREAMKNAFTLDLDEIVTQKLENIMTTYLSTLDRDEQNLLKIECVAWKKLPRMPVL